MSLSYAIRQIGDVTVLSLSGRVSLTETPSGPGGEVLLHELVRNTDVYAAYPVPFLLQRLHQMVADKATRAGDKNAMS